MISFLPVVLFEQFKFFFNLYFLLVAISQFIPALKVGYLFTYVAPLVFVLSVTILKEAYDDIQRYKRDKEVNSQMYYKLTKDGFISIPSSEIKVGDLIQVETNQRSPADLILLRTTEKSGASFIRTDQLDGETDWKLRKAVGLTQKFPSNDSLKRLRASVYIEKPKKDIYNFVSNFTLYNNNNDDNKKQIESLNIENTIWANTVVASGTIIGLVVYTGTDTRSVINASKPRTKTGSLDLELNFLSKILFGLLVFLSLIMVSLNRFSGKWFITFFRFILLFSSIIPISLRVNLDMGKTLYSFFIMRDKKIEGTVVRSSTIPEELGRVSYLMSDKTGTLTQNEMVFKKIHLGFSSFSIEKIDDIKESIISSYKNDNLNDDDDDNKSIFSNKSPFNKGIHYKIRDAIKALSLCHNVTPTKDDIGNSTYQASSPDEVALVKFTESVGMTLYSRDLNSISIMNPLNEIEHYDVLNIFPFTSETKRMGIIVRDRSNNDIIFYMKGADTVMSKIVQYSDWLDEECGNMAREGLRTLVFGMKVLKNDEYDEWRNIYEEAKKSIDDRDKKVQKAIELIEKDLLLIGLTGVEDKLQEDVKPTLEMLRNGGIKIWMLTGDKIETATCIAISARLVSRTQSIYQFVAKTEEEAYTHLNIFSTRKDTALIIDGSSLQLCLDYYRDYFISIACKAPSVVCCRCSPTQKAEIVKLIKEYTKKRTCAIGDGGNDVSMIQAADVGIGIVGKEGKQASLAADFSINQFSYISRLLLWHGRNSYKRSARLSQFIIHRGLIISFIQAVFSSIFYFAAIAIYNGWLLVGYATFYTMLPVFSLVLDADVSEEIAFQFPELYQDLQKGRSLSLKTFFIWSFISIFQGGMIMLLCIVFFDQSLYSIVSITFTSLILTELLNVAFEITKWHWLMIIAEVTAVIIYISSLFILKGYFDLTIILSWGFVWKVIVITASTTLPIYVVRLIKRRCDPPVYTKLK